ncbi:hypothetical protein Tco_1031456 [Tanacetum coccineum]|uniref:Uncharacterized protein n=1 Tax=Tanacetum coccineum TaxID=301880 RepID=A0ABQ5G919_9ASTR
MLLYIKVKERRKLLMNSVLNGPFKYGTVTVPGTVTAPATVKDRTYDELIDAEKIHEGLVPSCLRILNLCFVIIFSSLSSCDSCVFDLLAPILLLYLESFKSEFAVCYSILVGFIPYSSSPIHTKELAISNFGLSLGMILRVLLSCLLKEQLLEPALNLIVHCCRLEFRVLNGYDQKSFDEERGLNCVVQTSLP